MSDYHIPVMLNQCLEGLDIKPNGIYVDLTYGGGGHAKEILKVLSNDGKLIAFDLDDDAIKNKVQDDRLLLVKSNFRFLRRYLKYLGIDGVDGVLGDLGVSSFQFDEASRGFSYRFEDDLDMRMNHQIELNAADVLNKYDERSLSDVFWRYGELKISRRLAKAVVERRRSAPFKETSDFIDFLKPFVKQKPEKFWAVVFQALRIEVNDEMAALRQVLAEMPHVLNHQARIVVMSYHSLEDRIVKKFFRSGNIEGKIVKDMYGVVQNPFRVITRKPIIPDENEMELNSRSRSAKLRIAEFDKHKADNINEE